MKLSSALLSLLLLPCVAAGMPLQENGALENANIYPLPTGEHREWLILGALVIVLVSVVSFIIGRTVSRRLSAVTRATMLAACLLAGVGYFFFLRDTGLQLRWLHHGNTIFIGKWLMPIAGLGCGLLLEGEAIPRRRKTVLLSSLMLVCALDIAVYLIPLKLRTCSGDDKWLTLQSSESTCGPAACVTLLRLAGVNVTERDMTIACLTTSRGTAWQGMYRGLSLFENEHLKAMAIHGESIADLPLPAVVEVELRSAKGKYQVYRDKWGWEPGVAHAVVVSSSDGNGGYIVGDPSFGIEKWHSEAFDVLWNHEAIVMVAGADETRASD